MKSIHTNVRQRVESFWSGEPVSPLPYTIYWNEWRHTANDPAWTDLFHRGLGLTWPKKTYRVAYNGCEYFENEKKVGGQIFLRQGYRTPLGEVTAEWIDEWPTKYWLQSREDYRKMQYVIEHTLIAPDYQSYLDFAKKQPDCVIVHPDVGPSPIQKIIVDWAGLENFAFHLADYGDAVHSLFNAAREQFARICTVVAQGPGRFVWVPESFSAESMGPRRFREWILSVYNECFPQLRAAGKIVGVHFDGKTAACANDIAGMPADLIESLTPPPEGDQTLEEARKAWPGKLFWSNINVSTYFLPEGEMRWEVQTLARLGAPDSRGLAFEISEQYPSNWKTSIPVVLDALRDLK